MSGLTNMKVKLCIEGVTSLFNYNINQHWE